MHFKMQSERTGGATNDGGTRMAYSQGISKVLACGQWLLYFLTGRDFRNFCCVFPEVPPVLWTGLVLWSSWKASSQLLASTSASFLSPPITFWLDFSRGLFVSLFFCCRSSTGGYSVLLGTVKKWEGSCIEVLWGDGKGTSLLFFRRRTTSRQPSTNCQIKDFFRSVPPVTCTFETTIAYK
jgi:hypothetical protein